MPITGAKNNVSPATILCIVISLQFVNHRPATDVKIVGRAPFYVTRSPVYVAEHRDTRLCFPDLVKKCFVARLFS